MALRQGSRIEEKSLLLPTPPKKEKSRGGPFLLDEETKNAGWGGKRAEIPAIMWKRQEERTGRKERPFLAVSPSREKQYRYGG